MTITLAGSGDGAGGRLAIGGDEAVSSQQTMRVYNRCRTRLEHGILDETT